MKKLFTLSVLSVLFLSQSAFARQTAIGGYIWPKDGKTLIQDFASEKFFTLIIPAGMDFPKALVTRDGMPVVVVHVEGELNDQDNTITVTGWSDDFGKGE